MDVCFLLQFMLCCAELSHSLTAETRHAQSI